jgi:hypothetical protein
LREISRNKKNFAVFKTESMSIVSMLELIQNCAWFCAIDVLIVCDGLLHNFTKREDWKRETFEECDSNDNPEGENNSPALLLHTLNSCHFLLRLPQKDLDLPLLLVQCPKPA